MPQSRKGVKRPKLSQEKRFNDAVQAVWNRLAPHTASNNFNVPHSTLRRIVQCDGIYKFTLDCTDNEVSFRGRRKRTSELSANYIKNVLWVFST
jgi:hypothetical protein